MLQLAAGASHGNLPDDLQVIGGKHLFWVVRAVNQSKSGSEVLLEWEAPAGLSGLTYVASRVDDAGRSFLRHGNCISIDPGVVGTKIHLAYAKVLTASAARKIASSNSLQPSTDA